MTTLEKLAARVREEAKGEELSEIPCFICPAKESFSSACNDMHLCPVLDTDEVKSLTFARWAVKLVAEGLKEELAGYVENGWASDLADKLLDLITEVEASAGEKSLKEGDANG